MLMHAVESYLALRRALGFVLRGPAILLRSFACLAAERGQTHVSARTALDWAALAPSPGERACRLNTVIRFARHARAEDDRHELPPRNAFGQHRHQRLPVRFAPHEIGRLVEQALRLDPPDSLRAYAYSTLFGLLASTGLRISEALRLQRDDLTPEGLLIRKTKFRKSRLVPLHPTVTAAVERYLVRRDRAPRVDSHFFVDHRGRRLGYQSVRLVFLGLVRTLGLGRGGRATPHLHDLRHGFAIRALLACPEGSREQIGRHLVALSTYLGHASVADTYWYLQATPELMTAMVRAWESYVKRGRS